MEAYRAQPESIACLQVANSERIGNESPEFIALMNHLSIVQDKKASFFGTYETPEVLAKLTDIVISHQWGNPLNYMYLETCWQGYPLVHNATLCTDLGYYYPGNDVPKGLEQVLGVVASHDEHWVEYRDRQRALIARYLPGNKAMSRRYRELLDDVMSAPIT